MLGVALALIAIGVMLLFLVPWVGLPLGIVGIVLALLYIAGVGRRAAEPRA
jgi:hypothetical protein